MEALGNTNVISATPSAEIDEPEIAKAWLSDDDECIRVGLIAAPGTAADAAEAIVDELCAELGARYPDLDWQIRLAIERLTAAPVPATEIVEAARDRLLDEDWDLALAVTDLPVRVGGHPVVDRSSPTHRVGIVSLPSLGPVQIRRRLKAALWKLLDDLLLASRAPDRLVVPEARIAAPRSADEWVERRALRTGRGSLFAVRVLGANLRLFAGMVRANRPWRFTLRLYRVLVTALAAGIFAIITGEAWQLADALSWPRLAAASVLAVGITIAGVIGAHGLWERSPNPRTRQDVVLFNLATAATVSIGITTLYVLLFGIGLGTSYLVIEPQVLAQTIGDPTGSDTYIKLAWLLASVATLGGALGAGLETETSIREATYATEDSDN